MSYMNTPEGFGEALEVLEAQLENLHISEVRASATRIRHSAVLACRNAIGDELEGFQTTLGVLIERSKTRAQEQRKTGAIAGALALLLGGLGGYAKIPMVPIWFTFVMVLCAAIAGALAGFSALDVGTWDRDVIPPLEEALKRVEAAIERLPAPHPHRASGLTGVRIDGRASQDETTAEPLSEMALKLEKKG